MPARPIFLGIAVALFFRCMDVLLGPANTIGRGIRWAPVVHTVALFSFMTVPIWIDPDYLPIEYVNNREFPGNDEFPPGPFGYSISLGTKAINVVFDIMFPLNQWLADGLLVGPISNSVP